MNTPTKHICALCKGYGYRFTSRTDGYLRQEKCKRCSGTGYHGKRKVEAKPLAVTELFPSTETK